MKNYYDTFKYTYETKGGLKSAIYSRTDEVAESIVDLMNQSSNFYWKKKSKKAIQIDMPPYELEREQIEYARKKLEYRKERIKKGFLVLNDN